MGAYESWEEQARAQHEIIRQLEAKLAEAEGEREAVRERGLVAVQNVRSQRDAMERERDSVSAALAAAEADARALREALLGTALHTDDDTDDGPCWCVTEDPSPGTRHSEVCLLRRAALDAGKEKP